MFSPTRILIGTLAYAAVTFPLAYVWHLVAFVSTYEQLGYFSRDEPIIALGFGAIMVQGVVLSWLYPLICGDKSVFTGGLTLAAVMGAYHWTIHVVAEAAKHPITSLSTWFALETTYLVIQFVLAGLMIALVHSAQKKPDASV